ncbi:putative glycosyltransferase AER61 [Micractinium conductrix]|uniref:Glycosyltransferase AER61 n=1 Tax=Micractinium conductrix TaxID=554055 RepID=A0A2P6V7J0_9CHLO|nr:putative glycosyltransferase AER61 [Micractinium conductrix]|eukprot:PSC70054.1 putative glycosyltransferase AER61 [Micractinium conductrix]
MIMNLTQLRAELPSIVAFGNASLFNFSAYNQEHSLLRLHWDNNITFATDYAAQLAGPPQQGGAGNALVCFKTVLAGTGPLNRRVVQLDARPYRDAAVWRLGLQEEPQRRPTITVLHKQGRRAVENSAEVAAALQARYGSHARVTLVECCSQNKLTVHEQVKLMSDTSILITPSGGLAAMLNFLWPSATAIAMTAYHPLKGHPVSPDRNFHRALEAPLIENFPVTLEEYEGTTDRPGCELVEGRGGPDDGRIGVGGC